MIKVYFELIYFEFIYFEDGKIGAKPMILEAFKS